MTGREGTIVTHSLSLSLSRSPAEEAVNEVKRQAMSELQKAVSDAERKAHEMISAERSKMERALAEAKRQASEDALTVINQQEDSSEVSIEIFVLKYSTWFKCKCFGLRLEAMHAGSNGCFIVGKRKARKHRMQAKKIQKVVEQSHNGRNLFTSRSQYQKNNQQPFHFCKK